MPKPTVDDLRSQLPGLDEELARQHLERLPDAYFRQFESRDIAAHIDALAALDERRPVRVLTRPRHGGRVSCTVACFDYPSLFSLITGILAGVGFNIESGDVFTYDRPAGASGTSRRRRGRRFRTRAKAVDPLRRKRVIDTFYGQVAGDLPFASWAEALAHRLTQVIGLLEDGDAEAVLRAKQQVNRLVTNRLNALPPTQQPVLYPVTVEIIQDAGAFTRLRIVSQDTPAFLYSLSAALSLRPISIVNMRIRTIRGRVEDHVDLVDANGRPITDRHLLDQIRFSVLLTRQFSYFLGNAPDAYAALSRFGQLLQSILDLPESGRWIDLLANPHAMRDLAQLLGASDFLWEDFIRLQYESLLPLLNVEVDNHSFSLSAAEITAQLRTGIERAATAAAKKRFLNAFKNRQAFLIDLDHILRADFTFRHMAERLSVLAEEVGRCASGIAYDELVARHGIPRAVAGLPATFACFGLGKLGGAALGYASDIELLYVYSDNGDSDGPEPLTNREFYSRMVLRVAKLIEAKKEGIFSVDLRLRPHGASGPPACSLESFCSYYGPGGEAHAAERLALVRLRAIGGDPTLGQRIERLRDDFIFASRGIDAEQVRTLRARQFAERARPEAENAKFSRGALVDLEYAVQMLQVSYARDSAQLRTPRIHQALDALRTVGVLTGEECRQLNDAYDFLRRLINGLRMLRGSAIDLYLPPEASEEYIHLARRLGYQRREGMEPERQFQLDFATHTAVVRVFVERHFGQETLPGPATGNLADLILSDHPAPAFQAQVLTPFGFRNPVRAYHNLRALAGAAERRDVFARLAVLSGDYLRLEPDPDMALNNWERFVVAVGDPVAHFRLFLSQPRHLELLLGIFSRSQFLADTLIGNPDFLHWVTDPRTVRQKARLETLIDALRQRSRGAAEAGQWLTELRRLRRREMLRIGVRDMCLHVDTRDIIRDLSVLAEALITVAVERIWQDMAAEGRVPPGLDAPAEGFCVLAFGKLGGNELNYSSDIDLLGVYRPAATVAPERCEALYTRVMERLRNDLSKHIVGGRAYRVDLRLRPYGGAGRLIDSLGRLVAYYETDAALWELQAALKLRPVGGDHRLGNELLARLRPLLLAPRDADQVVRSIHNMRDTAVLQAARRPGTRTNIKTGTGGIRDIEFLVQGLQLIHAGSHPELLAGNTLAALDALVEAGFVPPADGRTLADSYIFLRRVEHCLQILEDQQKHALPTAPEEREALARRMLGPATTATHFQAELHRHQEIVRATYDRLLCRP